MNRERISVFLFLLLIAFCTASLLNTVRVSSRMSVITDQAIDLAAAEAGEGGEPDAQGREKLEVKIDEIIRCWQKYEPVISTYSRHDELERVSSAVRKLRPLYESGKYDQLFLTLHETNDALDHLRSTELPTAANIL